jgi:trans-aconitate methyltransferase
MSQPTVWNPQTYFQHARFVSQLGEPLLQLLEARSKERILDLGCGDGALTEEIKAGGATVIGIDASLAQLDAAKRRGLRVLAMDGQQLGFKRKFDAVFSNAALHWMKRPQSVVAGVASCLKSGGRFVGEFGGKGNVAAIRAALHACLRKRGVDPWSVDPWYYPSTEEYTDLLNQGGFTVEYIELIPRPTRLPGDLREWLELFAQPFSKAVIEKQRGEYLDEVRSLLASAIRQPDGVWVADYVRLRFKATRHPTF